MCRPLRQARAGCADTQSNGRALASLMDQHSCVVEEQRRLDGLPQALSGGVAAVKASVYG